MFRVENTLSHATKQSEYLCFTDSDRPHQSPAAYYTPRFRTLATTPRHTSACPRSARRRLAFVMLCREKVGSSGRFLHCIRRQLPSLASEESNKVLGRLAVHAGGVRYCGTLIACTGLQETRSSTVAVAIANSEPSPSTATIASCALSPVFSSAFMLSCGSSDCWSRANRSETLRGSWY